MNRTAVVHSFGAPTARPPRRATRPDRRRKGRQSRCFTQYYNLVRWQMTMHKIHSCHTHKFTPHTVTPDQNGQSSHRRVKSRSDHLPHWAGATALTGTEVPSARARRSPHPTVAIQGVQYRSNMKMFSEDVA